MKSANYFNFFLFGNQVYEEASFHMTLWRTIFVPRRRWTSEGVDGVVQKFILASISDQCRHRWDFPFFVSGSSNARIWIILFILRGSRCRICLPTFGDEKSNISLIHRDHNVSSISFQFLILVLHLLLYLWFTFSIISLIYLLLFYCVFYFIFFIYCLPSIIIIQWNTFVRT